MSLDAAEHAWPAHNTSEIAEGIMSQLPCAIRDNDLADTEEAVAETVLQLIRALGRTLRSGGWVLPFLALAAQVGPGDGFKTRFRNRISAKGADPICAAPYACESLIDRS